MGTFRCGKTHVGNMLLRAVVPGWPMRLGVVGQVAEQAVTN